MRGGTRAAQDNIGHCEQNVNVGEVQIDQRENIVARNTLRLSGDQILKSKSTMTDGGESHQCIYTHKVDRGLGRWPLLTAKITPYQRKIP
eukprot:SAG11_NODE_12595_length_695_cov_1.097315_2_plen_89_part_01